MSGYPWTPEEDEHLISLCGDMPWAMVVTEMKGQARRRGWRKRSESAMSAHATHLGLSVRSVGEWVTGSFIAETLGISRWPVYRWIKNKDLYAKRVGQTWYVSRKDLMTFARKHTKYFAGMSESELVMLFSNEQLASELAKMPVLRRRNTSPVIRVSTGQRFPTLKSAAAAYRVSYQRIQEATRTGGIVAGSQWRRA